MKNMFDYLKERKHITFNQDSFNEVDGLILSELIYTDFSKICDEQSDMSIQEVNQKFWDLHSEEEILASSSYTKLAPFLMKEMIDSPRYGNTRLKNYVSEISLQSIKQFAALTFQLSDGSDFIAYRGTDGTVTGWMEDFKFSYDTTEGQKLAVDYLNQYQNDSKRVLRVGGHSKGGNLAVYGSISCQRKIQDRIEHVYSYDGPGFKMNVLESESYQRILPRIISIVPKECIIGIMMHNQYNSIVTESDSFSIFQHDALQWHIEDNHFQQLESRSELSLFFEKIVNDWLYRFDEKKRKEVLEVLLSLIVENGIVQEDSKKLSVNFFKNLIRNTPKLTLSEKKLLLNSLSDVILSTSSVTANEIKDRATTTVLEKMKQIKGLKND